MHTRPPTQHRAAISSVPALAIAVLFASGAWARPRLEVEEDEEREGEAAGDLAATSADIPALSDLLKRSKWEPTPELSGVFKAGTIFEKTTMGDRPLATGCFSVTAEESTYTSAELVTTLQAGVSVSGPLLRGDVHAGIVKKVKFATPVQVSIPGIDLQLTATCEAKLTRLPKERIDASYVVQEVLRASISEQTCGRIDAEGRMIGLAKAEAEYAEACAQVSLEPVAVGFRTVSLVSVMGEATAPISMASPRPKTPTAPTVPTAPTAPQRDPPTALGNPEGYEMVNTPGGVSAIGCDSTARSCEDDEHPPHKVKLTHALQVGVHEVTQELYERITMNNPSANETCGRDCPVEQVSWLDAVRFANDLSLHDELEPCYTVDGSHVEWPRGLSCTGYRLPTEAEWEYIARSGKSDTFSGSDVAKSVAWTTENAQGHSHRVGTRARNSLGIYDMSGNVWEWVWDVYEKYEPGLQVDPVGGTGRGSRVLRGGSWADGESSATVTFRGYRSADFSSGSLGFRLVRTTDIAE